MMPKTYFDTTPVSPTSTTLPSVSHVAPCICVQVSNEEIRSIRSIHLKTKNKVWSYGQLVCWRINLSILECPQQKISAEESG